MDEPLALKLRPKTIKDIIGQNHLIGKNKILTNLINNKKIFSMIIHGNPGTGKTSLAYAIVNDLNIRYRFFNSAINNKKDLDIIIEESKIYKGLVLIIDEIHRLNKDKQDILLPYLESGQIILIGLTTSNPYHAINPAIRSRCQIFKLNNLDKNNIIESLEKAINSPYLENIKIDNTAINYIANISGSDIRFAYNLLEIAYYSSIDKIITVDLIKSINMHPNIHHDKNDTNYYDLLSAFQKSIRGSDVNASLYYLARLIEGNELESIIRRLTVIAYEDIGLANSMMGPKVVAAGYAAKEVGFPEARIILSEVVIELALSPKSNSAEIAIDSAIDAVRNNSSLDIPIHLKNGSSLYKYPHNYKNSYVAQDYLPKEILGYKFYKPRENAYEQKLKTIINNLEKQKNA